LLKIGGILEHDPAQVDRGRRGVNRAFEPFAHKIGILPLWSMCAWVSTSASIVAGSNLKVRFFSNASCLRPWKHSALEHDRVSVDRKNHHRPGDRLRRPVKLKLHDEHFSLDLLIWLRPSYN